MKKAFSVSESVGYRFNNDVLSYISEYSEEIIRNLTDFMDDKFYHESYSDMDFSSLDDSRDYIENNVGFIKGKECEVHQLNPENIKNTYWSFINFTENVRKMYFNSDDIYGIIFVFIGDEHMKRGGLMDENLVNTVNGHKYFQIYLNVSDLYIACDSNYDDDIKTSGDHLYSVMMHEITHVIQMSTDYFSKSVLYDRQSMTYSYDSGTVENLINGISYMYSPDELDARKSEMISWIKRTASIEHLKNFYVKKLENIYELLPKFSIRFMEDNFYGYTRLVRSRIYLEWIKESGLRLSYGMDCMFVLFYILYSDDCRKGMDLCNEIRNQNRKIENDKNGKKVFVYTFLSERCRNIIKRLIGTNNRYDDSRLVVECLKKCIEIDRKNIAEISENMLIKMNELKKR